MTDEPKIDPDPRLFKHPGERRTREPAALRTADPPPNLLVRRYAALPRTRFFGTALGSAVPKRTPTNQLLGAISLNPKMPTNSSGSSIFCAWFVAVRHSVLRLIGRIREWFVGGSRVRRIWFCGSPMPNTLASSTAVHADLECRTWYVASSAIFVSPI